MDRERILFSASFPFNRLFCTDDLPRRNANPLRIPYANANPSKKSFERQKWLPEDIGIVGSIDYLPERRHAHCA
jgi:hypothetical protein